MLNENDGYADVVSAITSLKEIVTIVAGLAITNAVLQLLATDGALRTRGIGVTAVLLFILVILNIIRFHHGNIRHLDSTYTRERGRVPVGDLKNQARRNTAIDFFVIFSQALSLVVLSFLLHDASLFFYVFAGLIAIDIFWYLGVYNLASDEATFRHQKRWTLNNVTTLVGLLILFATASRLPGDWFPLSVITLLALNTVADFVISWAFYFPKQLFAREEAGQ